ncbi:hypothetical protein SAMN02745146_0354 [Hymenobacter daecheongensis DSM 21074]|uniref:Uncharacterized protein n=1 Tax=Hymenobacter daecheongensis DSM 21074 TaxID=1121955 RepID=A0A1M6MPH3_9BACT|nr:hypothetical protein [Hymenobacter daecheongensis]SHJ85367.1 hypothetical protein SAMN02745146_0354 [Hymenobacter daecheongensis DSM 21074]
MRHVFRLLLLVPTIGWAQTGVRNQGLHPVYLKQPVEVLVRLNRPVSNAEHRLIMEQQLVAHLDTFSLQDLLSHPGIYFAALYSGPSHRGYQLAPPVTQGNGLYPFTKQLIVVEKLERPRKGRYYTRWQPAENYHRWLVRQDASDFGPFTPPNTLPGVDSVRVLYVLKRQKQ